MLSLLVLCKQYSFPDHVSFRSVCTFDDHRNKRTGNSLSEFPVPHGYSFVRICPPVQASVLYLILPEVLAVLHGPLYTPFARTCTVYLLPVFSFFSVCVLLLPTVLVVHFFAPLIL